MGLYGSHALSGKYNGPVPVLLDACMYDMYCAGEMRRLFACTFVVPPLTLSIGILRTPFQHLAFTHRVPLRRLLDHG